MAEPASPVSPGAKSAICDDTLTLQLQQFIDELYFRVLHSSVGRTWTRGQATTMLLDMFQMIGMDFEPEDKERLTTLEDDQALISNLVSIMPEALRERFEAVALQFQTTLHEATRIRTAAEGGDDAVATVFDEAGSDRGGLTQQVLKASVIHAAKEVARLRKVTVSWRKNTDARIDRLLGAAEEAEHATQQLLAAEAALAEYKGETKAKGKSMLLSMAEGKSETLKHSVFSSWLGYVEKVHAEHAIRKKFQDQIDLCERKLFAYKEAQLSNVRGVVGRMAMEETDGLMRTVLKFWTDEVKERKADGDTAEQMALMQAKMDSFEKAQKEKAGQFMTRMASGNEASLKNLCLEAWIKFHQDYAKDREMEEQVKASEAAFKKHMDEKKDEAKVVLDRMLAASDNGLLQLVMQNWTQWYVEEKKSKELEFALSEGQNKFKSLNASQKKAANGVQGRVNEQIALNLLLRCLSMWILETKGNRVENHYNNKYESKRKQLHGVQNLFKSFAMQLEQNLGQDDDSSSRTYRRSAKHSKSGMTKGAEGTVSLPDIHQRA